MLLFKRFTIFFFSTFHIFPFPFFVLGPPISLFLFTPLLLSSRHYFNPFFSFSLFYSSSITSATFIYKLSPLLSRCGSHMHNLSNQVNRCYLTPALPTVKHHAAKSLLLRPSPQSSCQTFVGSLG